jgi:undecaprenyl-diphosphatase
MGFLLLRSVSGARLRDKYLQGQANMQAPLRPEAGPPSAHEPRESTAHNWLASRLLAHPWRLLALFIGIVLPLAVSADLAQDILRKETLHFDKPILFWLHARSTPLLDHTFATLSQLGGFPGTAFIGTSGALWLWREKRIRAGWFWGLSIGGAGVLNMVVKLFFKRDRPTLWQSFAPEHDYSFPSGHSMLSASVGLAVMLLLWPTRWRIPALIFAVCWPLAVGLSRLYIGVHFPSDVLAGWCAGAAWTTGVYFILRGERDRFFERIARQTGTRTGPQVLAEASERVPSSQERLGNEKPIPEKTRQAAPDTAQQKIRSS